MYTPDKTILVVGAITLPYPLILTLPSHFPPIPPTIVQYVMYTPDKTILVVGAITLPYPLILTLPSHFPPIPPTIVQYVMYTPDKTILVVGANGGLYVYDDRLTDVKEVRHHANPIN